MAGAYKCDICGALFAERPSIEQDVTWFLAQTVDRGYTHPADMCQECMDNLQIWVKNRGKGGYNDYLAKENDRLKHQIRELEAKIHYGVVNDQGRC